MEEATKLTEISNAAYADYSEAVYNNAAYNTVNRADYTAYASPPVVSSSVSEVAEADPSVGYSGGSAAPIKVEVHIHIEGNAAPETVDAWREFVNSGELDEHIRGVIDDDCVNKLRGAYQ